MNARERVRLALTCQRPDRIPVSLGFFGQSLPGIPDADEYFGLDVRYAEFSPPAGQDNFLRYLRRLPPDVHVGTAAQLRTYHEWDYAPDQIRAEVQQRIGQLGPAGLLLAPAYDIDFTPLENIVAFVEATREFGHMG